MTKPYKIHRQATIEENLKSAFCRCRPISTTFLVMLLL